MGDYILQVLPIPLVYLCIVILILLACEGGFRIGHHLHRKHQDAGAHSSVGPIVGGMLGMLAFVLAFTFSMAATQHGQRKHDVLAEANDIGTAYLRADFLGEPRAGEVRDLLREYLEIRVAAAQPGGDWRPALKRSLEIHELLWAQVSPGAMEQPNAVAALLVTSVNEVIDMHEQRFSDAVRARIPGSIWLGLLVITVLTMGTLGLQVGLSGKRRLVALIPISMAFAVLATLIVDLNRPQGGLITVSQQSMIDVQDSMGKAPSRQVPAP